MNLSWTSDQVPEENESLCWWLDLVLPLGREGVTESKWGLCSLEARLLLPSLPPQAAVLPLPWADLYLEVLTKFLEHLYNHILERLCLVNCLSPILEAETSSLLFRAEYAGELGEKTEELVCSTAQDRQSGLGPRSLVVLGMPFPAWSFSFFLWKTGLISSSSII